MLFWDLKHNEGFKQLGNNKSHLLSEPENRFNIKTLQKNTFFKRWTGGYVCISVSMWTCFKIATLPHPYRISDLNNSLAHWRWRFNSTIKNKQKPNIFPSVFMFHFGWCQVYTWPLGCLWTASWYPGLAHTGPCSPSCQPDINQMI